LTIVRAGFTGGGVGPRLGGSVVLTIAEGMVIIT